MNVGYMTLENGVKIPMVSAVVGRAPRFLLGSMPVLEGRLGEKKITVLRDAGCNTIGVRRKSKKQFLLSNSQEHQIRCLF